MLGAAGLPPQIQEVWCPDFLPLLLWSSCQVTREVGTRGHGTRPTKTLSGVPSKYQCKLGLEATDPRREPEELIMDCKCQPQRLCFQRKSWALGPEHRMLTPAVPNQATFVLCFTQKLEKVFHPPLLPHLHGECCRVIMNR